VMRSSTNYARSETTGIAPPPLPFNRNPCISPAGAGAP